MKNEETFYADTLWAQNETELNTRWRLLVKMETLYDVARTSNTERTDGTDFPILEKQSREKICRSAIRGINRFTEHSEGLDAYLRTIFLKSISNAFDPHTDYKSKTEMQTYVARLSTEGYYFGFALQNNPADELAITSIVPGEPAWHSGHLDVGDVMEKVRWEGKDWVEMTGLTPIEIDNLFAESNTATMEFVVRKPDATLRSVKLKKARKSNEESLVRGFLLQGKSLIGYIALPVFYTGLTVDGGSRCAHDVAKEIIKLKNHSIDGLILDLRTNGGGSLGEAVDIAGIFIDVGPVGIQKDRGEDPVILKDANRGTIYDGPMVIMVNKLSASASEFVAAALQDYGRAIIVGSPTYGKAVGQEMFSLQPGNPEVNFNKLTDSHWGYSTITTTRIYRISGKTIQKYGLTPDVELPDLNLDRDGELNMPYALSPDFANKKTYWQPLRVLPLNLLREKSRNRIRNQKSFHAIQEYSAFLRKEEEALNVALDWKSIKTTVETEARLFANYSTALTTAQNSFSVGLHEYGAVNKSTDQYADSVNEIWIKNLSGDISLEEAFNIVCDYIDTLKRR